jgi:hypothetical protein
MVKSVDRRLYKNYLRKAEEMLDVAEYALGASKFNAAVTASVHCAINAMDALAVFYFGRRHRIASETGREVNYVLWRESEFSDRVRDRIPLISEISRTPVIVVVGEENEFKRSIEKGTN